MDETLNIQKATKLSKIETYLLARYTNKEGKHSATSTMIILGLIPYLKTVPKDEIIPEAELCINEINEYLEDNCSFSVKLINKELKIEILSSEFNLKEEIA